MDYLNTFFRDIVIQIFCPFYKLRCCFMLNNLEKVFIYNWNNCFSGTHIANVFPMCD